MSNLKSTQWLLENINLPELIILDASQDDTATDDNSKSDVEVIPGAQKFDLKNNFSDTSSPFPNTFPSEEKFECEARKLGINSNSIIVIYDNKGIYTSPRAWWMFKSFGHENVYVLDGGLTSYAEKGEKLSTKYLTKKSGNFKAKLKHGCVRSFEEIKTISENKSELIIDARSKQRFNSEVKEPRKGLRSGNIPTSINLPHTEVKNGAYLKSKTELTDIFNELNIESYPLVFTCGSGVTACILRLAFMEVSSKESTIYDGSWTEWGTLVN